MTTPSPQTSLSVEIDAQDLTIGRFHQLTGSLTGLIREVADSVEAKGHEVVRWVIADVHHSNITLDLAPQRTRDDVSPDLPDRITDAIASGMAAIQARAERPPHFSDAALERAKELANSVGDEVRAVRIRAKNREGNARVDVSVTKQLVANVDEIIGAQVESFGTVEGRMEGLIVHDRRRFYVWDSLTNRRVECQFGTRVELDEILAAFGKRVGVRGVIRRRKTGEKVSVEVAELRVFPPESELPSVADIRGIMRGS